MSEFNNLSTRLNSFLLLSLIDTIILAFSIPLPIKATTPIMDTTMVVIPEPLLASVF